MNKPQETVIISSKDRVATSPGPRVEEPGRKRQRVRTDLVASSARFTLAALISSGRHTFSCFLASGTRRGLFLSPGLPTTVPSRKPMIHCWLKGVNAISTAGVEKFVKSGDFDNITD
jgi:hypothetical protein